jgi:ABC-type multidrug transport system ATPase subunit
MTVRECIVFSALLRMNPKLTVEEKVQTSDAIILDLGLHEMAGQLVSKLSGGQRRRASIGQDLVVSPSLLLLDEPTSGLDSHTASSLIEFLSSLCNGSQIGASSRSAAHGGDVKKGCSRLGAESAGLLTGRHMVIMSIHQPSQNVFAQFDRVMCLSHDGLVACDGATSQAGSYVSALGFDCPPSMPVPDSMLKLINSEQSSALLVKAFRERRADRGECKLGQTRATSPPPSQTAVTSLSDEITVLTWRSLVNNWRTPSLFALSVGLSLSLGLGCGLLFYGVTPDLRGFQNRTGAFYFMLTFFAFTSLGSMDKFVSERRLFIHECEAGYFSVGTYFLAKIIFDAVLLRVVPSILFSLVFYWLVGLQPEFSRFATFLLALMLFNLCTGSQAMVIGLTCKSVGNANVITVCAFLFQLLFGGFLVNAETLPSSIKWLEYFSVFSYAFEALMCNELEGPELTLDAPGLASTSVKGDLFLATLGMDVSDISLDFFILLVVCLFFFSVAFCILVYYDALASSKDGRQPGGVGLHAAALAMARSPCLVWDCIARGQRQRHAANNEGFELRGASGMLPL